MKKLIGVILLLLITTTVVIADPPPLVWCHRHQRYHHKDHTMLTDNLVSWWSMNETSDGSAPVPRADSHGPNDLSDPNNTPSIAGKISNAASMAKASSHYLEITDANQTGLNVGTNDFAIAFWYYYTIHEFADILSKYSGAVSLYGWTLFNFNSRPALSVDAGVGGPQFLDPGATWIWPTTNTWYHVVLNFDRDGTVDLWRNGVKFTGPSIAAYSAVSWSSAGPFALGKQAVFGYRNARFDEVGVWVGRTLTEAEIAELYNGGDGIGYPSPVANIQDWIGIEGTDDTYTGVKGTDDTYTGVEGTDNQYPALIGVE